MTFCSSFGLCPLPLQESTLCRFAASLAGESLCHQTIVSYLSACRYFQILSGLPDLSLSSLPQLSYVLKGARRTSLVPRRTRLPITPELLRGVLSVWSRAPPTFDRVMLWAAFSMGFFAFLRAGEFTCQSLESFDQSSMLALGDVWVDSHSDPRCLTIKLKRSKGDPFGQGVLIHLGCTFQSLCPVAAVLSYLAIRPSTPGPFFVFSDGSPLSRERLISALSQALKDSGVDPSNFKGHSFRIGAATTAAKAGLSDSLIQALGRWRSSAFMSYIRTPKDVLLAASVSLAGP